MAGDLDAGSELPADQHLYRGYGLQHVSDAREFWVSGDRHGGMRSGRELGHFIAYNGSVNPETFICNFSVDTNWDVYSMVWGSGSLSLSMDGQALSGCSVTGNAVPSNPMFLILQTQTASNSPFGPPNNSLQPTTFNIDYLKVTQP
jgi:hypothetical protein